jgi:phosphoglycerol transferase
VAALCAVQSAYYSGMFLQLLFWAAVYGLLRWRDWRRVLVPTGLVGVVLVTVVVMNVDTIWSKIATGHHPGTLHRFYSDLELYALKPVELLLPRSHSMTAIQEWTHNVYFNWTMFRGEQGSAYAGAVGILALALLLFVTAQAASRRSVSDVPVHFWGVSLVGAFSVVGGINGIVGLAGLWLFRASNRYSIVIITILLLFLVKHLSAISRRWHPAYTAAAAVLLTALGIWDQVPPRYKQRQAAWRTAVQQEAALVSQIEARLPENAMVFQLPVWPFPEGLLERPMLGTMEDYEPFRPYLHSSALRFSYGDAKGRYENGWQKEAELLGASRLVQLLEEYGFSAVLINREAYPEKALPMLHAFASVGKSRVIARSPGWLCIALNPRRRPSMPPVFRRGWYPLEVEYPRTRRWSSGDAILTLHNPGSTPRSARLAFSVETIGTRRLTISQAAQTLYEHGATEGEEAQKVELEIQLAPGTNTLAFKTDKPGQSPGANDLRELAFSLLDFQVRQ